MAAGTKQSPKQQPVSSEKLPDNIIERRVIKQKLGPRAYKIEVFFLPYPSEARRREAYKKWVDALFL